MRYQAILFVCLGLIAADALAQSAPPTSPPASSKLSDSWTAQPAHSGSASYRSDTLTGSGDSSGHFKFKDRKMAMPNDPPPANPMDKAPIMGQGTIGPDGRPPVNCPETPQDPKCH